MKKRSFKCADVIALSSVLSLITSISFAEPGDMADMQSQAQATMGSYVAPKTGDGSAVHKNLVDPMVNGSQMNSLDDTTSFNVGTFNASGKSLLQVAVSVAPTTGDVSSVVVRQDIGGTGTLNTTSVFPAAQAIAGVCANGYIQCPPGQFDTDIHKVCSYFQWQTDSSGKVISTALPGAIGAESCYCFNTACSTGGTATAIMNIDRLTADLAGGLVASFVSSTGYAITNSYTGGAGIIDYFGVKPTSPTAPFSNFNTPTPSSSGGNMPLNPYTDIDTLTAKAQSDQKSGGFSVKGDGDSMVNTLQNSPDSLFSLAKGSMMPQSGTNFSCRNDRTLTLQYEQKINTQSGSLAEGLFCTDSAVRAILNKSGADKWTLGIAGYNSGFTQLDRNCSGTSPLQPSLNANGFLLGDYTHLTDADTKLTQLNVAISMSGAGCTSGSGSLNWFAALATSDPINSDLTIACTSSGAQSPGAEWLFTATSTKQVATEGLTNGCASYEADSKCQLVEDIWDNRPVMLNGYPSGVKIINIQKTFTGDVRDETLDRAWWRQDRKYYCQTTPATYDFTDVEKRTNAATASANSSGDQLSYVEDGNAKTATFTDTQISGLGDIKVCKTSIPVNSSLDTGSGAKAARQTAEAAAKDRFTYYYKECSSQNTTLVCPVDASKGETVVMDCTDNGAFGEAMSSLSSLNAMQDATCSSK